MSTTSRPYGGRSGEQRQAERRQRLLDAAFEIWGDHGWTAVSMRATCARAGLIDRYFYENFTDRDALLAAVWDQIRDQAINRLLAAIADAPADPIAQLRAAISAFVHDIAADHRRARIAFGEHTGSTVLEQRRRDTLQQFTDLLIEAGKPFFTPDVDHTDLRMSVLLGVGGFTELVTAWLAGTITTDAEHVIDHTTAVGTELVARYLAS